MWPKCEHGYNTTPSHKCPWCFGGDTSKFEPVVGKGNGWLLDKGRLPCKTCGGPRHAGYGAFNGTQEEYWEAIAKIDNCYSCMVQLRLDQEALAIYVVAARDISDAIDMINECGDSRILDTLLAMVTAPGSANTDTDLNMLLVGPVTRALAEMMGEG
jgi:hypothetical protein